VGVKFGKYLRHGFFNQVADVYIVYILVVNDMKQIIDFVTACVDDTQSASCKVIGIETAKQQSDDYTDRDDEWNELG
jgi:hypothetical protein